MYQSDDFDQVGSRSPNNPPTNTEATQGVYSPHGKAGGILPFIGVTNTRVLAQQRKKRATRTPNCNKGNENIATHNAPPLTPSNVPPPPKPILIIPSSGQYVTTCGN